MKRSIGWVAALGIAAAAQGAQAQAITKETTGTDLAAGASWVGGSAPGSGNVATWTATGPSLGGTLTLTDGATNTWQGVDDQGASAAITIQGTGTNTATRLQIGSSGVTIGSSGQNLTLGSGGASSKLSLTFTGTGSQTWSVASGKTLTLSGDGTDSMKGGDNLVVTGAGTVTTGVTGSGYTGSSVTFQGGITWTMSTANSQGTAKWFGSNGTTGTGATVNFDGVTVKSFSATSRFLNNNVVVKSGGLTIGANGASTFSFYGTMNLNGGTPTISTSANLTASGVVSNGGLTKTGGSTLTLSNTGNTFAGTITAVGGILQLSSLGSSGTNKIAYNGGIVTLMGSASWNSCNRLLQIGTVGSNMLAVLKSSGAVAVDMTNTGDVSNGGTLTAGAGLSLGGTNTGDNYFRSRLTDLSSVAIGLSKVDAGRWILTAANTYTGSTTVTAGTLALDSSGALGSSGTISMNGGTLQFSAGNTNDYTSGSRLKVEDGKTATFDTNDQNVSFASALNIGVLGTGGLTKTGGGTLTLGGANHYTGATAVNGGTLSVTGSLGGVSAVTVASGATLAGTGTVGGATTVDGTLAPGTGTPGTLAIGNTLILNPTASLAWTWASPTLASVSVTGDLTLGGIMTIAGLATMPAGTYTLITYTGVLTDNGMSLMLPPDGRSYGIDTATAGQVKLTITEEPPYDKWWLTVYGIWMTPPKGGDYDGDGTTNGDEFAALTNPTDNTSYLHLTNVTRSGNDTTISVFTGGANYDLERTDNLLGTWTDIGDITGNEAIQTVTDPGAATGATWFYRVKVK